MKIGIVGCGHVGATTAYACLMQGIGNALVLVDQDEQLAAAQAEDISHAVPFAKEMMVTSGSFQALTDADIVMVSAGVSQKYGETRLDLLKRNADVFEKIIPEILNATPNAILLIATNPVDVMTHIAARISRERGQREGRVIGTGTILDTARFRTLLAQHLNISTHSIHAHVLGEHGDSEVLNWSSACITGIDLHEFAKQNGMRITEEDKTRIDETVRNAGYRIQKGKGETCYGVAAGLARIARATIDDEHAVLACCAPMPIIEGIKDITLSLPHCIGSQGIVRSFLPAMDKSEHNKLEKSAQILKSAMQLAGY